jgi:PhzF family phenazine biosynthesis protein
MSIGQVQRFAAFTENPEHGNPAGVWIGDKLPGPCDMLAIAAGVGYSETAFLSPTRGSRRIVRYYSPEAEVPFCGHATIAAGVAMGQRNGAGTYQLSTRAGDIPVTVQQRTGLYEAALTSVEPRHESAADHLVAAALDRLGWSSDELDNAFPVVRAYAGAWHLVVFAATRDRLSNLDYDFEGLKTLMLEHNLTTLQLAWRESDTQFHARNPFPVGGVVEDPATGAAAAALGGYLRNAGFVEAPAELTIRQGEDMGRPGLLRVGIPRTGGIMVAGTAVVIDVDLPKNPASTQHRY